MNIALIVIDTLRYDYIGANGNHLDRNAEYRPLCSKSMGI